VARRTAAKIVDSDAQPCLPRYRGVDVADDATTAWPPRARAAVMTAGCNMPPPRYCGTGSMAHWSG